MSRINRLIYPIAIFRPRLPSLRPVAGFKAFTDKLNMNPAQLDAAFPYVCFAYGALMTVALNIPAIVRLAETRLAPDLAQQWKGHRAFAFVSLLIGSAWILEHLWVSG